MNRKITEDLKERIDKNGFPVDFIFCCNYVTFISIAKNRRGGDVICIKCRTDKFITWIYPRLISTSPKAALLIWK